MYMYIEYDERDSQDDSEIVAVSCCHSWCACHDLIEYSIDYFIGYM